MAYLHVHLRDRIVLEVFVLAIVQDIVVVERQPLGANEVREILQVCVTFACWVFIVTPVLILEK